MDNIAFGNLITALRKKHGLTQAQLAKCLDVTDKAVSRWETGKGFPELTLFPRIAEAFDVTVEELMMGKLKDSALFLQDDASEFNDLSAQQDAFPAPDNDAGFASDRVASSIESVENADVASSVDFSSMPAHASMPVGRKNFFGARATKILGICACVLCVLIVLLSLLSAAGCFDATELPPEIVLYTANNCRLKADGTPCKFKISKSQINGTASVVSNKAFKIETYDYSPSYNKKNYYIQGTLFDADGNVLRRDSGSGPSRNLTMLTLLSSGDYYLELKVVYDDMTADYSKSEAYYETKLIVTPISYASFPQDKESIDCRLQQENSPSVTYIAFHGSVGAGLFEEGLYSLYSYSFPDNVQLEVFDGEGSLLRSEDACEGLLLSIERGGKYYVSVKPSRGNAENLLVNLHLDKIEENCHDIDTGETINLTNVQKQKRVYYRYRPSAAADASTTVFSEIKADYANPAGVLSQIYDEKGNALKSIHTFDNSTYVSTLYRQFDTNRNYYFFFDTDDGYYYDVNEEYRSIELSVKMFSPVVLPCTIDVLNRNKRFDSVLCNLEGEGTQYAKTIYVKYTPNTDVEVIFTASGDSNSHGYNHFGKLFDGDFNALAADPLWNIAEAPQNYTFTITYKLKSGCTYYLAIKGAGALADGFYINAIYSYEEYA